MSKFARIDNGFVVETLTADSLPEFHPSLVWVACADVVVEGYSYDGNSFSSPEQTTTVEEAKTEKLLELKIYRDNKYNDGYLYNGDYFQIDAEAQRNATMILVQFTLGNSNPHGGQWFDIDNVPVAMNDTEVQAFIQAALLYISLIKSRYWFHDAAIKALNAKSDIEDYDFTTGWP